MKKLEDVIKIDECSATKRLITPKNEGGTIEVVIDDWSDHGKEKLVVFKDVTRVMIVENKNGNGVDIFMYDTKWDTSVSYIPKPISDIEVISLSDKFDIFKIK